MWNGNEVDSANRQKFQLELPDTTHVIECFDVHPIFSKYSPIHTFAYNRNNNACN